MFNFTSTILVNTNLDSSGKALWDYSVTDTFNVKRTLNFKKANVISISKRAYSDPVLAKATLDMSQLTQAGLYRIAMYIRLSGSAYSLYSNDLVFKGLPKYVEFEKKASESAAQLAEKVAKAVKMFQIRYDYKFVDVTTNTADSAAELIITATDEYQRFTKVDVEFYNDAAGLKQVGDFETIISARTASDPDYDTKNTIVQGVEGFGTYNHILKDLRLPTIENFRWKNINAPEMPIPGAKYNEYVINYVVERGIMGGDAVGELAKSQTTHVFYVNQAVSADFEVGLGKIGTIKAVTNPA